MNSIKITEIQSQEKRSGISLPKEQSEVTKKAEALYGRLSNDFDSMMVALAPNQRHAMELALNIFSLTDKETYSQTNSQVVNNKLKILFTESIQKVVNIADKIGRLEGIYKDPKTTLKDLSTLEKSDTKSNLITRYATTLKYPDYSLTVIDTSVIKTAEIPNLLTVLKHEFSHVNSGYDTTQQEDENKAFKATIGWLDKTIKALEKKDNALLPAIASLYQQNGLTFEPKTFIDSLKSAREEQVRMSKTWQTR